MNAMESVFGPVVRVFMFVVSHPLEIGCLIAGSVYIVPLTVEACLFIHEELTYRHARKNIRTEKETPKKRTVAMLCNSPENPANV